MDTDGAAVIGSLCSKIVKFYMQNDFSRTLFVFGAQTNFLLVTKCHVSDICIVFENDNP